MAGVFGVTIQINFWTGAVLAVPILVWTALKVVEFVQKHTKYWKTEDQTNEEKAHKKSRAETSAIFQMIGQVSSGMGELDTKVNGLEHRVSSFYEGNIRQQTSEAKDIESLVEDLAAIQEFFGKLNTELSHRFELHDKEQGGISQKVGVVHDQIISKSLAKDQEKAFEAIGRMANKIDLLVDQHGGSTGIAKNWWCQCTMAGQTSDWPAVSALRDKTADLGVEVGLLSNKMDKCFGSMGDLHKYIKTIVEPILVAVQQSVVLLTEVSKNVRELQLDVLRRGSYSSHPKERDDEGQS